MLAEALLPDEADCSIILFARNHLFFHDNLLFASQFGSGKGGKKKWNNMKNGAKESQKKEKTEKKKSKLSSTIRDTSKSSKDEPDEDLIEL